MAPKSASAFLDEPQSASDFLDESPPGSEETDAEIGAGETVLHGLSSIAGGLGGGLNYVGTLAATGDPKAAEAVRQDTQNALTFEPRTPQGQGSTAAIAAPINVAGEKYGQFTRHVGELEAEQGRPLIGTLEQAGLNAIPMLMGADGATPKFERIPGFEHGAPEAPPTPPAPVDGPVTAADLRASPERLTAPPPAPASTAIVPTPTPELPPRVPVPGKPHIRPKAQPAAQATQAGAAAPQEPAAGEPAVQPPAPGVVASTDPATAIRQLHADTGGALPEVRSSALSGDHAETAVDHAHSTIEDDPGRRMAGVIRNENAALTTASQNVVNSTGGRVQGTENEALQARGLVMDRALGGVRDWFDTNRRSMYAAADQAAGGVPMTQFGNFHAIMSEPSNFTGAEGMQLHGDVQRMAQHFGLQDGNGFWKPTTAANVERFRQWVSEQYTPRTGKAIRQLKDALDQDVAAHGGQNFYMQARALRQKQDAMLERENSIAKLIPERNPDGTVSTNRPVAVNELMDHIANLHEDQFNHLINTLHDSAKLGKGELAEGNAAAIRELKAHMAEMLHEAGAGKPGTNQRLNGRWDSVKYRKKLDQYALHLPKLFTPGEIARLHTVRDAGTALHMDSNYPKTAELQRRLAAGTGSAFREHMAGAVVGGGESLATLGANAIIPGSGALVGPALELSGQSTKARNLLGGKRGAMKRRADEVEGRISKVGGTPEKPTPPLGQRLRGGREGGWIGNRPEPKDFESAHEVTMEGEKVTHKPATVPVEHFIDDDNYHNFRAGSAHIRAQRVGSSLENSDGTVVKGHDLQIRGSSSGDQGQGHGSSVYRAAADYQISQRASLHSDETVSADAARRWDGLRREGYNVTRNPGAQYSSKDGLYTRDGSPVFTLNSKDPRAGKTSGGATPKTSEAPPRRTATKPASEMTMADHEAANGTPAALATGGKPAEVPLGLRIGGGRQAGAAGTLKDNGTGGLIGKVKRFFRGTEMGDAGKLRFSPDGEMGRAIYATQHEWLARTYGGGPKAKVGAGRQVHELNTRDLDPNEVGYVEGGSKVGENARLVDHQGNVLHEYDATKKSGAADRAKIAGIAKRNGIKVIHGREGSVAENQTAILDPSVLQSNEPNPSMVNIGLHVNGGPGSPGGYQATKELEDFVRGNAPTHHVDPNGPTNFEELMARRGEKSMPVNPQEAEGSIYSDVPTNIAFRAWHDKLHQDLKAGFDHDGELKVAMEHQRQAEAAGLSQEARNALWADTWETFKHHESTGQFPSKPREFVASKMQAQLPAKVNIGLHVNGGPGAGGSVLDARIAKAALRAQGVEVGHTSIQNPPGGEPTLVADIHPPLTAEQGNALARKTGQQSIPQRHGDGTGTMLGEGAQSAESKKNGWDKFNSGYFQMHDGRTARQHDQAAEVAKHLTPEERNQVSRGHAIDNVVKAFHEDLPEHFTHELAAMSLAGAAKRGWYRQAGTAITAFHGPDAPRFTAVLAAQSPRLPVPRNFTNTMLMWDSWDRAGRPTDPDTIMKVFRDDPNVPKDVFLKSRMNNTIEALTHPNPEQLVLSGPKVHSFFKNLMRHVNESTNDGWMAAAGGIDAAKFGGSKNLLGPGKSSTYLAFSAHVRAAAKEVTRLMKEHGVDDKWTPEEIQETTWSWFKTALEHATQSGESVQELMRRGEINDELIRSTPDFHSLFGSPELAGVIRRNPAGHARLLEAQKSNTETPTDAKAREAAQRTLQPHLKNAVKRVEDLRQARGGNTPEEEAPF